MRDPIPVAQHWFCGQHYTELSCGCTNNFIVAFLFLAFYDSRQKTNNKTIKMKKNCQITFVKDRLTRGGVVLLLTFISTDSLSFSRLIILMATFLPITQCTPNLTSPARGECKRVSISFFTYI